MDHFSKYIISFLISNKKASTIVSKLNICFKNYGIPEQLNCDNGKEFINKKVKKLVHSNNIKLIKGMPYNPHSQGVVERTHQTVKNALICQYLDKQNLFNLKEDLTLVINIYNNMILGTTKKTYRCILFS